MSPRPLAARTKLGGHSQSTAVQTMIRNSTNARISSVSPREAGSGRDELHSLKAFGRSLASGQVNLAPCPSSHLHHQQH